MKNKKSWMNNENFRDVKTGIVFVFAYLIAIVSNGFIEGFEYTQLFSFAVGLGTMGIYGAVQSLTREGAARGNEDAEINDEQLRNLKAKVRECSAKIKRERANPLIHKRNKTNLSAARLARYEELMLQYDQMITVYRNRIDLINATLRWYQVGRKLWLKHFTNRVHRIKKKQAKLTPQNVYVKFDFVELDDIISLDKTSNDKLTEKQKLKENPAERTVRKMRVTNFAKTIFFFGLQGAIYASLFGRRGLGWFLLTITATLLSTIVVAYFMTYKDATGDYKNDLNKKIELLEWLIVEQDKKQPFVWEYHPDGREVKKYV